MYLYMDTRDIIGGAIIFLAIGVGLGYYVARILLV